ncbi:Ig-like domain-containing protein [Desulfosarcina alkanivorans]|nr:Ig-like domain-containing protein [Desulfosarcina alkanivorans]
MKSRNRLVVFLRGTPGASVTIEIRKTGSPGPPPQVVFSAEPVAIHSGESSVLTWTSTNADSLSIDQGVGPVDPVGSIFVSPSQTTTYTLTAVHSGGTTTAKATIAYENSAPEAVDDAVTTDENTPVTTTNVIANDMDIDGDDLTLSGFTQAANGTVTSLGDGTFTYTPDYGFSGEDHFSYTVGDGHGGWGTAAVAVQVVPGMLSVEIASPAAGQAFSEDSITVTGRVNRTGASIFVNGIAATLTGNGFVAINVPLVPGINTISVLAEDGGDTAVASTSVMSLATIDLNPVLIEVAPGTENDGSPKVSGQAMITVANKGSRAVISPFHIVLFEDTNLSRGYEEAEDNRLGEAHVSNGLGAGEASNVSIDFAGQLLFRDNRIYVFVDSAGDVQESDEDNNIIATGTGAMDLSASLLQSDEAGCPDGVGLTVRIGNSGETSIHSGIPVAFYDGEPGGSGMLIGTVRTTQALDSGQYEDVTLQWPDPPVGETVICARADDDGTGTGSLGETDVANNQVCAQMAVCTSPPSCMDGISGRVVDALTGDFLPGVTVFLHGEENGNRGAAINQTDSDEYGGFVFTGVNPGVYVLVADQQGYIEGQRRVVLAPDEILVHRDVVLSPVLNPGEFRVVLTWGEHPMDLEAHLTAPNADGCRHHCFYWNRSISGASLDVDDRESFGPETITISQMDPGTYRFYVHDFTNRNSAASTALANSDATVSVFSGSGDAPLVFSPPAEAGNVWHVFNLDGSNGTIIPIDKMTHQTQPGQIDFPKITSFPPTIATTGEPYVYQIEAVDPDQDTLVYTLVEGPEGMALDPFSGLIEWTPGAGQGGWFDVAVRADDGRCGQSSQTFRVYVAYLPVVQFAVEPCSGVNPGGEITLSWQVERADTVMIDPGIGEVSTEGSLNIQSPDQPIRFTLTAVNDAGQVQRSTPRSPAITNFSAECVELPGGSGTLTWASDCAVSCVIDQGVGTVSTSGSLMVTPAELPSTYTLTCSNGAAMASGRISVAGCTSSADISVFPDCGWSPGDPVTLSWSASGVDDCSIDYGIGSVPIAGTMEVFPDEDPTKYTLTCSGASDSVEIKNPRRVELAASTTALLPGESTALYWKTNCIDTCSFDQGIGAVPTSGSLVVTPEQLPITYTLTAIYDQYTHTIPVTISLPMPVATFAASPAQIKAGESATLTWSTDLAASCTIEPYIGEVPLSGSIPVAPDQTTTYTLVATGPGGTSRTNATVAYVKPTAAIYADPVHLDVVGQTTTLSWVFSNADTCMVDQGIGTVQLGGSLVVTPEKNTTYTITATGPGGMAKDRVAVVYPSPTVEIHADREILDEGETATLTWTFGNADTCSIDPAIGDVQSGGSVVVDPERTTTYTITAAGPGGIARDSVTVTCRAPAAAIQASPVTIIEGQPATLSWQADHAATYVIAPDLGPVDSVGLEEVTPAITTSYTLTASGRGGTISDQAVVTVINPPSISVKEPDGRDDSAHTNYIIRWTDTDHDSDAVISLYYDINSSGADGTLIAGGISEDLEGQADTYVWETTDVPPGAYYVYARIEDGVNDAVIAYSRGPVTIDHQVASEIKLTANDGLADDHFGSTVAIDGDYAVVGAPNSGDTGAVYVFRKQGATWVEQCKLTAGDGARYDHFGTAVSISGDMVVVGAPGENDNHGAVYVFRHDGSTWAHQAKLIAGDGGAYDHFGTCLSLDGDTLVVGAPDHNGGSGAAYVYTIQGNTWSETIKLAAGEDVLEGHFGTSVSTIGDLLAVGSPSVDNLKGAVFIFRRVGSAWEEDARLASGSATRWERFGTSVSIDGKYAIVGNSGLWEAMVDGAAYIFMHDGTAWVEQTKISSSSVGAGESFGQSVYLKGDMAAVGQPKVWNDACAVYLFQRSGSQWVAQDIPDTGEGEGEEEALPVEEESFPPSEGGADSESEGDTAAPYAILTPSDGTADDWFGNSVAMDDDHVIVGAMFDDDKGGDSGSAYIFPLLSVSIETNPVSIDLADPFSTTTALSWTSRGADTITIDPDIGVVSASGSLTIAPRQSTTYTITGARDGVTATDSVTVTVIDPSVLPTVTIGATQETVARGDSAILTWSATNVASVTLDNEIGPAPMTGNLLVFPEVTTTYTVTAVNAAGTATANVTVTVTDPLPTVELSVQPLEITAGEPATLVWDSTHVDAVTIEPGIGMAGPNGTLSVAPMQTTTYTITAIGTGGTVSQSATVRVDSPISINIVSPTDGAFIEGPDVMVRGSFASTGGSEPGIRVNGVVAMVYGNEFVVNNVPLEPGTNTIIATAMDINGHSQSADVSVSAAVPEHYIELHANITSGSAPLDFSLHIRGTFSIQDAIITYTGIAPVELMEVEPDEFQVSMIDEGIAWYTAKVVHEGVTYTDTIAVMVVDVAEIDALLQQKWADMKKRLGNGDIPGALEYFSEATRPTFEYNFNLLNAHLDEIIAGMRSITLVKIEEDMAEYNLVGEQAGQPFSFYLLFQKTGDGTWRIVNF